MPRASQEQVRIHKARIEQASARLVRERGLRNTRVADVMAAAGLTQGGFYGHFKSKDALAAAACSTAFQQSTARWEQAIKATTSPQAARATIIERYLGAQHLSHPAEGCPTVALATYVAREPADKPVRQTYTEGVKRQIDILKRVQSACAAPEAEQRAMTQLCLLVGAMALARATRGDEISTAFLSAAKDQLLKTCA